jgi:hypothetical protein
MGFSGKYRYPRWKMTNNEMGRRICHRRWDFQKWEIIGNKIDEIGR